MRFLSKEAKEFQHRFSEHVVTNYLHLISELDIKVPYAVSWSFYFLPEDLLNKTYDPGKKGSAKSRYKRLDIDNRVKLSTDCLVKAIGIDDSQFFHIGATKYFCAPGTYPRMSCLIIGADLEAFGLPGG